MQSSELAYLVAIAKNDVVKLSDLIDTEADGERRLKIHSSIETTPLHLASEFELLGPLSRFLHSQSDVNILQFNGCSPLYIDSQKGNHGAVELLVRAQADVAFKQSLGATPLYIASQNGHAKVVKLLLRAQAEVNVQISTGESPIHCASRNGHGEVVGLLAAAGADLNHQLSNGVTPLYIAAQNGHTKAAKSLIEASADLNLREAYGCSPLYIAAQNGHAAIVTALVRAGADVDLQTTDGFSPLLLASQNNFLCIVKAIIGAQADVNRQEADGCSPLYMAAQNGHEEVARVLIEAKARVDLFRNTGSSPLYAASQNNHERVVKLLIDARADVDAQRNTGESALYSAAQNGHKTVTELLISSQADVNLQRDSGEPALYTAAQFGHLVIIDALVRAQADIDLRNNRGCTALYIASQNGHDRVVALLAKAQADVNAQTCSGNSPLFIASQDGHSRVVDLLLDARADVNLQDSQGGSPLYIAAQLGRDQIVRTLIKGGADVDLPESSGCTPIFIAAQYGHETVVRLLLEAQANPSIKNHDGVSPSEVAQLNGHHRVVSLLRQLKTDDATNPDTDAEEEAILNTFSTDSSSSESELSRQLHQALSRAGFVRSRAALQSAVGDVLQQILDRRLGAANTAFIVGSYSEGWGNSLSHLDGRTDLESDIDMMRLIRGRLYHLDGHCRCDSVKSEDLVAYENGHIIVTGFTSNPAVPSRGSAARPAIDHVYACRLCCYPASIGPLKRGRATYARDSVLDALRHQLASTPCHVVHAAAPGQAGGQLRVSTTFLENRLLRCLTSLQGQLFVTLKYLVKKVVGRRVNGLKAYHAKTVTFRMLEETPTEQWQPENLINLTRRALEIMIGCCGSESSEGRIMEHFFLEDAGLYLKGADRGCAAEVAEVLRDVLKQLPELLLQFQNQLRPIDSTGRFYFHPFVMLPILDHCPLPSFGQLEFHQIIDIVRQAIIQLSQDDCRPGAQSSLSQLLSRLPESARTARETLRAIACLKFGLQQLATKILAYSGLLEVSRGIEWPAWQWDFEAAVHEEFVWNYLNSCDSAWKFCIEFEHQPQLPFLPKPLADWSMLRLSSGCYFINFDAVLSCLRLHLLPDDSSARSWVTTVLLREDADEHELLLSMLHCRDLRQLAASAARLDALLPMTNQLRLLLKERIDELKRNQSAPV